ncbi:hypothetical protein B566_EDAN010790 [Ephemera danica]|nr:hypothetical protein B566_EDAN010790 [Ephemera danica]
MLRFSICLHNQVEMPASGENAEHKSPRESGEDSEDESEILEESPCGRWLKRREEFTLLLFGALCPFTTVSCNMNPVDESGVSNVRQCLCKDVNQRPNARQLLLHPLLFDVHPLKLLAAHVFVKTAGNLSESLPEEVLQQHDSDSIFAEIVHADGRSANQVCFGDLPHSERIGKYVEDVKYGIYPLTAFLASQPPRTRAASPEVPESVKSMSPEPMDVESRRVVTMMCSIKPREEAAATEMQCPQMCILLRMDDKMNRQLTCSIAECDTSLGLSQELVRYGFINEADRDKIGELIEEQLRSHFTR